MKREIEEHATLLSALLVVALVVVVVCGGDYSALIWFTTWPHIKMRNG